MNAHFNKTILFFDGTCVLCNKTVQWLLNNENDKKALFFCLLQSDFSKSFVPEAYKNIDSVILYKDNRFYIYFDAFLKILPNLKWYWKFLYIFQLMPSFLGKIIYKRIANNRKNWFGQTNECWILTSEWKRRVIE